MAADKEAPAARQPATSRKTAARTDYVRPAVAAALLIAAIAGIGATTQAPANWNGSLHRDGEIIAAVLEVVLLALLIALWLARSRRPHPGHPAEQLRMILPRAIVLVMATVAAVAITNFLAHRAGRNLLKALRGGPARRPPHSKQRIPPARPAQPLHVDVNLFLRVLIAVILAAAIAAIVLVLIRRRRQHDAGFFGEYDDDYADDSSSLRQAVASGRTALHTVDDAQAAIIACYVAMESSLAQAGAARMAAETPDELLARAVAAGLLHGSAAGQLTQLFYEARFSSHALPASAKDTARDALDAISADLDHPASTGATA